MSEDYLWDKSGEPDQEIQQLEQILGSLRYQPKPLELPEDVPAASSKSYWPLLAIAASLLVAAFAGLLWFQFHNRTPHGQISKIETPAIPKVNPVATPEAARSTTSDQKHNLAQLPVQKTNKQYVATNVRRIHKPEVPTEEALQAKEQLMTALRLASEKLSLAQKRAQGPAAPNQIRNQHKNG